MATSTAKTKTPPKSAAPAAKAKVAAPKVAAPDAPSLAPEADGSVPAQTPGMSGPQLRKKDLVARVVAALDGKKKGQVKEIVEATLATLGEALAKGEALNLPPFGRARIARQKGEGKTSAMTLKLRGAGEKNAPKPAKQALAEPGEDD